MFSVRSRGWRPRNYGIRSQQGKRIRNPKYDTVSVTLALTRYAARSGRIDDTAESPFRLSHAIGARPNRPELTAILRHHIKEFGLSPEGRLFVGGRNKEELPVLTINRIWRRTRGAVFTPEVAAAPLAETPYDLRHAAVWPSAAGWRPA